MGASNSEAAIGSWVVTPTALEVQRPGYRLLGWATDASFPVGLARTLTLPYDATVGGTRMIFIPAGIATLLSDDNELHAIWDASVQVVSPRC